MHDEWKMHSLPRNSDWIYIGADSSNSEWSKIGKTSNGLETRHRSSQNPTYFIFRAYEISGGMVDKVEAEILKYIENGERIERLKHISTGRKSECFVLNPIIMADLVENFISCYYPQYMTLCPICNEISRYQCPDSMYKSIDPYESISIQDNHKLSKEDYFSGNKTRSEIDLGNGHFHCLLTNRQGWRDKEGYEYFD